ncbi:MAG: S8 family serine peptidase, partial [Ilumatobacter sp.]
MNIAKTSRPVGENSSAVAVTSDSDARRVERGWGLLAMEERIEAPATAALLPHGAMYHVVDQIGARALWQRGITGAGVNVAVIDTGVAPVPALSGPGKVVAVADLSNEAHDPTVAFVDTFGHGTAMAGIIAGAEPGADPARAHEHPDQFFGVAPDAGIVSVKISGRNGASDPADVIAGIDWVIEHAEELDIKVINLSYDSGSLLGYRDDPLTAAVERAWHAGIVVVAIAGNNGGDTDRLASPAVDPYVIAVASADVDEDGVRIGSWSNAGDGVRQPDIAAPGGHIQTLRAPGSFADTNHSDVGGVERDARLFQGTGTSESAAVISGVLALLFQQRPDLTPDQAKALICETAAPIAGSDGPAGAELVQADVAAATETPSTVQTWDRAVAPSIATAAPVVACTSLDHWGGAHWGGAHWGGAHWGGAHWGGA